MYFSYFQGSADVKLFGDKIYSNKECTLTFAMDRGAVCNWDYMER
jgi:hypothetical protein